MEAISFESAEAVLAAQPFNALLQMRLTMFEPGSVRLEMPITESVLQQHGFVQGGAIASIADNALTFAGGSVLGPQVVTRGFTIEFVRPGLGSALIATATVSEQTDSEAKCNCEVLAVAEDGAEKVCATAHGVISRIPRK